MPPSDPAISADIDTRSAPQIRLTLRDEAATLRLGEDLAFALKPGMLVALSGDLGAGKSTLARALIRTLAGDPALEVPSPTYTLVQPYETRLPVTHADLYRIGAPDEIDELGLDEALEAGVVLAEWPERAPDLLTRADLSIRLEPQAAGGRIAVFGGSEAAVVAVNRTLAIRDFLAAARRGHGTRRAFTGDASSRRYETVTTGTETVVLMDSPRRPDGPPIRDGLPYSRIAHLAEDVVPFVAIASALTEQGFAAPEVLSADLDAGLLLIEHLGGETLLDAEGRPVPDRYEAAALCLAAFNQVAWPHTIPVAPDVTYEVPAYDRRALHIETELLTDWYVPRMRGAPLSDDDRARYHGVWNRLFDQLDAAETSIVLRDFHSPNVIWRDEAEGHRRIGIIDFQDALIGPSAYDLASLAQDARVDVSAELEARLVSAYLAARRKASPDFDETGFRRAYAIMAAQRNSKILGIFVRLLERDGKPQYLRHIPRIKGYLKRTLTHPDLGELAALYDQFGVFDEDAASLEVQP
ncbi:tRNA (adenosine(37)-N6)-threonylcarbamoyltransferase complex ATPase subunit type 1 TsaE [Mangrovicella endophytica]|uniref:tRNA (adenosine(37)-N6)-threonylcarbamoyltransferase complex ATPase subunit type 1 TsaE n=1 Tax=Mangrovicella endophytica TaxID=2066697 RepID=UPI000C9E3109|nr:tRNA (adenosine(37)-N6)-threonylcarbamoyltransferase complex ATPase subunit type 1 TsaE [Mangrovicella endophytica]